MRTIILTDQKGRQTSIDVDRYRPLERLLHLIQLLSDDYDVQLVLSRGELVGDAVKNPYPNKK